MSTESKNDTIKLMYFNGRGLMEVPRTLFAAVGKYAPADFEDFRFAGFEAFGAAQATGELGSYNLNRVPLLIHNGVTIGQGGAISRYVAKVNGLMGSSDIEGAQIDMICEAVSEIGTAWGKIMHGNNMTAEEKEAIFVKWSDTDADAGDSDRSSRYLQWHLKHIEKLVGQLGTDGYSFGSSTTLADAMLYNKLGDECKLAEGAMSTNAGPFGFDKPRTDAIVAKFPKVAKIVATFAASTGMQKYKEQQAPQYF